LYKQKLLFVIAVFLLLSSIVLYFLLHDIERLYIFSFFKNTAFVATLKKISSSLKKENLILLNTKFIRFHIVDILWFSSFTMITSNLWGETHKKAKYLFILSFAFSTELLQLFFPKLGTFDIYDMLIYFLIVLLLIIVENT